MKKSLAIQTLLIAAIAIGLISGGCEKQDDADGKVAKSNEKTCDFIFDFSRHGRLDRALRLHDETIWRLAEARNDGQGDV